MELESQQKTPVASPAPKPPLQFDPTPRVMQPSVLFGDMGRGQVDASTLAKLQDLAGPAPGRLSKLEARPKTRPAGSAAQNAHVEVEAGVLQEEELAALTTSGGGPLQRILALQLQQTAMLSQKLLPKSPTDAITGALGSEGGNSNTNGVRGGVAREAYLRALEDVAGVGKAIMMNAATDLGLAESQIGSGLMRLSTWSDECPWAITAYWHSWLSTWRVHGRLPTTTTTSWPYRTFCQRFDDGGADRHRQGTLPVRVAAGGDGRPRLGSDWHRQRTGIKPHAKLASSAWIAGNIAYLKDIDYLETRLRSTSNSTSKVVEDAKEETEKPWRKKKKGKAKEESADTSAAWSLVWVCMLRTPKCVCPIPFWKSRDGALALMIVIQIGCILPQFFLMVAWAPQINVNLGYLRFKKMRLNPLVF